MKKLLSLGVKTTVIAALLAVAGGSAFAQTTWQKTHPRRVQVNHRLAKQNQRITHEVKEGEISKARAHALRANDKSIRTQERAMAANNGSHITRGEQKVLNQELNKNSAAIGK